MATRFLNGFFVKYIYPAALSAFGVAGNAYLIGRQLDNAENELRGAIKDLGSGIKWFEEDLGTGIKDSEEELGVEIKGFEKDVSVEIKGLEEELGTQILGIDKEVKDLKGLTSDVKFQLRR